MTETEAVAKADPLPIATMEQVLVEGDLSKLTGPMRLTYYRRVCESLKLNPLTKPFDYIVLNGKLRLYANRTCSDQLRAQRSLSLAIVSREFSPETGLLSIVARATGPDGRFDESIAAIDIGKLTGEALANAMMKCETKAKRRVTLSYCGLGWSDESEVLSIPKAQPVAVNHETGEFIETTKVGSEAPRGNGGGGTRAAQSSGPAAGPPTAVEPNTERVVGGAPGGRQPLRPVMRVSNGEGVIEAERAAPAQPVKPPAERKPGARRTTAQKAADHVAGQGVEVDLQKLEEFEQERAAIQAEQGATIHNIKKERGPDNRFPRGPRPDDDPWCPKCGGPMHDMRPNKRNPRAPDWCCQMAVVMAPDCDGVRWPRKADGSDHAAGA
jgi:hypothetical protein